MDRGICSLVLRYWLLAVAFGAASLIGIVPVQAQELCGGVEYPFPYTDVSGVGAAFCPGIMEAYVTGISKGTSPTTFSPNETVTRVQMSTFLQRSLDQVLTRGSRRAALNQWWTPQSTNATQVIPIGGDAAACASDGQNIWVGNQTSGNVVQVQAGTGKVLGTWTGATDVESVLVAAGKVFLTSSTTNNLYMLDPTQPPGAVTTAVAGLNTPTGIAFDGTNIWVANAADDTSGGSVSIITPQASTPYPVTTVNTGFSAPSGVLFDGSYIWVADPPAKALLKVDASGNILQTVNLGAGPNAWPVFDGANIWVPIPGDGVTVVQASTGDIVATIAPNATNHMGDSFAASFDGERILITNFLGNSIAVFKAADLSFITSLATGAPSEPRVACSDGVNFWVPLAVGTLLRF